MENLKIKVNSEAESKEVQELFFGVGVRGGKYKGYNGNNKKTEYSLWTGMLKRCYSKSAQLARPSYIGCVVSDNFKEYDYFYEWCQNQIGFNEKGFQLDKDLLKKGNRIYSEDLCLFLPSKINTALILRKSKRGKYPIGVTYSERDRLFASTLTMYGKNTHVGYFKDEMSAFLKYKEVKEAYLKDLAKLYKKQINPLAYLALLNYEVSIND